MNEYKDKIKSYHIFLLSCLLASLMILNSNNVNYQKQELKSQKEKEEFFSEMIKIRKLSGGNSNTEEVCSRADDDLIDYYKTGDLSKIDLDDEPIKCEDKDKSYMKTLIDIVREMSDDSSSNAVDGSRLRNLGSLDTNKLVDYLMRILPFLIFFVFGILSIFGWIICGICCCCDCCCCCCCKKDSCKVPCFIFTFVFYALSIAISIYGLTQSKKIFVGLANTECSILKFFGQVLDGEIKQEKPRWAGISNINNLLNNLSDRLIQLKAESYSSLSTSIGQINTQKGDFRTAMETSGNSFFTSPTSNEYKTDYSKDYNSKTITNYPLKDTYVLDIVKKFGRKIGDNIYTEGSSLNAWNQEFSTFAQNADNYLQRANNAFDDILGRNINDVTGSLNSGAENLDKITKPFTDAEKKIGKYLADYSEDIDKYGKMSVTIVFSVLMVMNLALAVLMILIYLFSTKTCEGCICFRCLFKFCTHILWNVLALMMLLSFIIGSILGLIGTIGGDMMSLISYIMSKDNFDSSNPLLLNKLKGKSKKYIERCIHLDGDISKELDLGSSLNSFQDINNVEANISSTLEQFNQISANHLTFEALSRRLQEEVDIKADIFLLSVQGEDPGQNRNPISYQNFLHKISTDTLKWDIESTNKVNCDTLPPGSIYHPKFCKPLSKFPPPGDEHEYADILNDIDDMVSTANSDSTDSFKKVIQNLDTKYTSFLNSYTTALRTFQNIIRSITTLVRQYSGDDDAFSFLNGKFIRTNLKIVLKYLKYSLGVDLYTVGVCLIVVALSLALSVSSTILLVVIINIELKKNQDAKKLVNTGMVPEMPVNYPQSVIGFK